MSKDNKKQWNHSASQGYMKKAYEFIEKNKRYVIAAGALICFVLILFFAVGKGGLFGKSSSSGDAARFAENKNKDVEKLIRNYYDAYAKGDVKKLSSYAAPISPNEVEYIKLFGGYIKEYTIKKIYAQQGIDENSCCVTVEIEIEFEGVTTKAPGLDFFYITGLQTGTLYINNLYSQFNLRTGEYVTESQIDKCINKFENRPEMKELQEKIQKKYEEAILKDEKLDILINETINTAVNEWMETAVLLQNEMPPAFVIGEGTDDNGDDNGEGEGEGEDEPDPQEEEPIEIDPELEIIEYAITTAEVNVRYGASTEKRAIGKAAEGAKVIVLAIDPWGEWSYVQVNDDLKGFIRNDFLITQDNEESIAGLQGYPDKEDKVAVSEDVDLMNSMKSYGKVITRLMSGTQVTIINVYRNGFAKVTVNGKIGYLPITSLSY